MRVAGLAGAGVAMPGYAAGVFDNPSNIGPIKVLSLEAAYAKLPDQSPTPPAPPPSAPATSTSAAGSAISAPGRSPGRRDNLSWVAAAVYRLKGVALGTSAKYVSVEDSAGTVFGRVTSDAGVTLAFFDIAALGRDRSRTWGATASRGGAAGASGGARTSASR